MTKSSSTDEKVKQTGKKLVYLVGENEHLISELLSRLELSGYGTQSFIHFRDLETVCKKEIPAAIIMDANFRDEDKSSADMIIKLKDNLKRWPAIIFTSGHDDIESRMIAAQATAHRYFCTPLNMDKLIRSLDGLTVQTEIKPYQVMLVISDTDSRKHCTNLLCDAGMEVEALSNSLESFKLLSRFRPDVIIIDMDMPECAGPELIQMIRQDDNWALMPVISLSTKSGPEPQLVTINLEGDDFLTKPVNADQLVAAVTSRAKRSRWTNRLNKDLKTTVRESKFQLATMNEHNIVSIADVTGRITYVNDKFCEISGYTREELIGQNHRLLKSSSHTKEFYDDMWTTISQGRIWRGTISNCKKGGGIYWVESTIVPFLNDRGKPYKYVSVRTDVTALRESEERLHRGQSFANIGTWDWNISKGELFWSDNIWLLFGYEKNSIGTTYENFIAAVHPDDREMVETAVNNCVMHGADYDIEHRVIWPDGSSHWVLESGNVVRDVDGTPLNMLGVVQDIDKRKRTELSLIERQRQLREAQTLARLGNWQSNLATGERIWSDEVFRIIGQEPDSCDTTTDVFYKAVHPDDVERVFKVAQWAEKTGHKDIVYRIILPDGSIRHVHDLAKADVDMDGNMVMLSGTVQDITERVEAETRLRETEERFTFAVEGAGDGIWDWDLKTDSMQFSELYMTMLGYSKDELHHHVDSWVNSVHPDDLAPTKQKLNSYLEGRSEKYSLELRLLCKDGSYKWILCRGTIVSRDNEGQPSRMIGIHSDITKQKCIEKDLINTREDAENANRAKTEFLSSMSHELRTPMNAIMGFGQLLKMETDPPLSDSQHENVDEIITASNHLLELINEVLDLAKIESGRIALSIEVIVLAEVIAESLQLVTPLAQRRGIEIVLTQNGDAITFEQLLRDHAALRADRIRLKQVLLNLLSNAIKYNNENGELIVDFNNIATNTIRISVTDTGKGLTLEEQAQLFKPFSRIGADMTKVEGIGIGLVITKNLVELMGGTIGIHSQPGVGSTFWIELPADNLQPNNKLTDDIVEQYGTTMSLKHEYSILYIEDNPANLRLVTQLLERRPNIHMWSAHEPLLGLELASEHKPDLILLDINLPSMNGFEVLGHLRGRNPTRDTPVIAISANAMPNDIQQGINAGFDDYITKPIDVNILLQAVEKSLQKGK